MISLDLAVELLRQFFEAASKASFQKFGNDAYLQWDLKTLGDKSLVLDVYVEQSRGGRLEVSCSLYIYSNIARATGEPVQLPFASGPKPAIERALALQRRAAGRMAAVVPVEAGPLEVKTTFCQFSIGSDEDLLKQMLVAVAECWELCDKMAHYSCNSKADGIEVVNYVKFSGFPIGPS